MVVLLQEIKVYIKILIKYSDRDTRKGNRCKSYNLAKYNIAALHAVDNLPVNECPLDVSKNGKKNWKTLQSIVNTYDYI